jgi:maltose/moltooligosaccharide transporter
MLPEKQRTSGFAMQTFFIGVGAVIASALPWIMTNWFEVSNTAPAGEIPESVKIAFYVGGAAFLLAVSWTVFRSREYSPEQLAEFEAMRDKTGEDAALTLRAAVKYRNGGLLWLVVGAALLFWIVKAELDKELYILGGGIAAFGLFQLLASLLQGKGATENGFYEIMHDLFHMPRAMRQLAIVQFFSWFALFAMWIYGTSAVTSYHFGATDVTSAAFNDGADWNGILFASYNLFAALAAIAIPFVANRLGCRVSHMINLTLGGIGLISFYFIGNPKLLLISMVGVGFAWASILSLPYALLSNNLPAQKMGVYMGIFNFFIVIPQLVAASILGLLLREFFDLQPIFGLVIGGVSLLIAGAVTLLVDKSAEPTA